MVFSRQQHWSRLSFPPPGELPDAGIELMLPESPALTGSFFTTTPPGKAILKPQWIRWFHTAAKNWNQQGLESSFTAVGHNAGDVVLLRLHGFVCKWGQLFFLRWWESFLGVSAWREGTARNTLSSSMVSSYTTRVLWKLLYTGQSLSDLLTNTLLIQTDRESCFLNGWLTGWLNHYRRMYLNSQAQ